MGEYRRDIRRAIAVDGRLGGTEDRNTRKEGDDDPGEARAIQAREGKCFGAGNNPAYRHGVPIAQPRRERLDRLVY